MSVAKPPAQTTQTAADVGSASPAGQLLFALLAALLAVRPLLPETYDLPELSFVDVIAGSAPSLTARFTLSLDLLLLLLSGMALLLRPLRWRFVPLAGLLLLAAGVGVSTSAAADPRAALNAGASLLTAVIAGMALLSLMHGQPQRRRMLVALLLAVGVATAVKCYIQHFSEFPELREFWPKQKQALAERGYDLNDPSIINFERRMNAAEASGYLSHSNIAASCLAIWLIVLVGVAGAWLKRYRTRQPAILIVLGTLLVGVAFAIWLTGSLGGEVAALVGAAAALLLGFGAARFACWPRLTTTALLLLYCGVVAGGVWYGLRHDGLPGASLEFRWRYWTATLDAYEEVAFTGLGRENFGGAYLRYKSPVATEEVRNPHNLWLNLLIELGPLGLAGALLLLLTVISGAMRRMTPTTDPPVSAPATSRAARWPEFVMLAALLITQALGSALPLMNAALAFVWLVELATPLLLGYFIAAWILWAITTPQPIDDPQRNDAPQRAATRPWLRAGLLAALLAALVHGLIDFALFTPAGLALFVALAAVVLSPHAPSRAASATTTVRRRSRGLLTGMIVLVAAAAQAVFVTMPTVRSDAALRALRAAIDRSQSVDDAITALKGLEPALRADRLDPDTPRSAAMLAYQLARAAPPTVAARGELLERADAYLDLAQQRNPQNWQAAILRARMFALENATRAALGARSTLGELQDEARAWRDAIERYPTEPRSRIEASAAWLAVAERAKADGVALPHAAALARADARAALAIDDLRKPEEAVKLSAEERARAEALLRAAEALLSPTTASSNDAV